MYFAPMITFIAGLLLNTSGPTYSVVQKYDEKYEVRNYDSWVVAETIVEGTHQNAGNKAFNILAGYIFGANDKNVKIEMTAPVTQQEIALNKYAIQFYMPSEWTLETLPKPNDNRVQLKTIPARKLFVVTYHGGWSDNLYNRELNSLQTEANKVSVKINTFSQPIWARYNSPMAPSFLRTNQVMYEVL